MHYIFSNFDVNHATNYRVQLFDDPCSHFQLESVRTFQHAILRISWEN